MEKNSESKIKNKKQKKDKKDKKKKKAKTTADSLSSPNSIVVKTESELSHAVLTNTLFTLDASFTRLTLPPAPHLNLLPIIEALTGNTTVTELALGSWTWTQTDLRSLVECLSALNKGITKITLQNPDFKPEFVDALSQILKTNRRIKTVEISGSSYSFYEDGWALFCKGMAEYHFEDLTMYYNLTLARHQTLFESLKHTRALKKLTVSFGRLDGPVWTTLCDTLIANPTIREVTFRGSIVRPESFTKFKEVIHANSLKKLTFLGIDLGSDNLTRVAEELKKNTSITDLTLVYCTLVDWQILGDILRHNRTIERLNIDHNIINPTQFPLLNLSSNTTVQELSIFGCHPLADYSAVFSELSANNTIKRLTIGKLYLEFDLDPNVLRQFIEKNSSIIELGVHSDYNTTTDTTLRAIADGLKVNRTITKLSLKLSKVEYETFKYFTEVLMLENNKVLELELHQIKLSTIKLNNAPLNAPGIGDLMLDLVTKNKSLRHITGAEDYPLIDQQLKANRATQDKTISDTCTWLKMIGVKPYSFVLPIEIWMKISSDVSYEFSSIDFEQFLRKLVHKKH